MEGCGRMRGEDSLWGLRENARRVLQATAVEAYGKPGAYVVSDRVMGRATIADVGEFRMIAEHLQAQKWIAEAEGDCGVFVLTTEGIDEAMD